MRTRNPLTVLPASFESLSAHLLGAKAHVDSTLGRCVSWLSARPLQTIDLDLATALPKALETIL
jgi:hypothetical protein